MPLIKLHHSRVGDLWDWLSKACIEPELDPENILIHSHRGAVDVYYDETKKIWFLVSSMYTVLDAGWKTQYILAGWSLDKLDEADCLGYVEELKDIAVAEGQRYLLFNLNSRFLTKLLDYAGEDAWLQVR